MRDITAGRHGSGAQLTIDLDAVRENYRRLRRQIDGSVRCAAVVKADAYGLGAVPVSAALHAEGCEDFFVAQLDEGLALRSALPDASIYVLNGVPRGAEHDCSSADLLPVLNSLEQAHDWAEHLRRLGEPHGAVIQIDSGMNRLGLSRREVAGWVEGADRLSVLKVRLVMSHLACADTPQHRANRGQLALFSEAARAFPGLPRSLASSSGIFLGPDFHFDLVRPGVALYGGNPVPSLPNPMRSVVRVFAPVIQVRDANPGDGVGYGWDHRLDRRSRIATVAIGYADGLHRALQGRGAVYADGIALPVLGRVSMDTITVDASAISSDWLTPGSWVEVIGEHQSIDQLAEAMQTSAYEVLTSLGHRYARDYAGAVDPLCSTFSRRVA